MKGYVTPPEAAKAIGVSERTMRRWLRKKLVPARRMPSGHWQIAELWIEEQRKEQEVVGVK